jgi:hypothetical protein
VGSKLIVLLFDLQVSLVTVSVAAGFASSPRARVRSRMFMRCLTVPALVLVVVLLAPAKVGVPLAWMALTATMLVVPAVSCLRIGSSPGRSDDDSGGGSGRDRPSGPPEPSGGDFPLPDAGPSRVRVRDHSSPRLPDLKRSREREPERESLPSPARR